MADQRLSEKLSDEKLTDEELWLRRVEELLHSSPIFQIMREVPILIARLREKQRRIEDLERDIESMRSVLTARRDG